MANFVAHAGIRVPKPARPAPEVRAGVQDARVRILSPTDLAFLWGWYCPRCFYRKVIWGFRDPEVHFRSCSIGSTGP